MSSAPKRVFVLGATGTIGRATVAALVEAGHEVTCFLRLQKGSDQRRGMPKGVDIRFGEATDPRSLADAGFRNDQFDALVSCMASRTGMAADAYAVDYKAHASMLSPAHDAGISHIVLLSAICVQKPRLAFQYAKIAAEEALMNSGITYSIVRPTAFFKSLSGQVARVQRGRPFLLFGDGEITSCKPISDRDLGRYLAGCLEDSARKNRILPIGGPGPAITPLAQGHMLFRILGQTPRFRQIPVSLMNAIITGLDLAGTLAPCLHNKAELARIGRYYATESMLVLDPSTGRYDEQATPEFGTDTLEHFYRNLVGAKDKVDLGDHAVFG